MSVIPEDDVLSWAESLPVEKPRPKKKDTIDSTATVLDEEFTALGYPGTSRLSILGDVGRENNWDRNIIFKGHSDPKNQSYNRGIISWQGDRRTALDNFLKKEGVLGRGDDDELRGMARFMDKELKEQYPDVHKKLLNPKSTYDASEALRRYIKYVPDAPYNSPDPEFRVKNNAQWAKKARDLGLGQELDVDGIWNEVGTVLSNDPENVWAEVEATIDDKPIQTSTVQGEKPLIAPKQPLAPDPNEAIQDDIDRSIYKGNLRYLPDTAELEKIGQAIKEGKEYEDNYEVQTRFNLEQIKNPSLTVEEFNKRLQDEYEAERVIQERDFLEKNKDYAEWLKAAEKKDSNESRQEFNEVMKAARPVAQQQVAEFASSPKSPKSPKVSTTSPATVRDTGRGRRSIPIAIRDLPDENIDQYLTQKVGEQLSYETGFQPEIVQEFIKANKGNLLTGVPYTKEEIEGYRDRGVDTIKVHVEPRLVTKLQNFAKTKATEEQSIADLRDKVAKGEGSLLTPDWEATVNKYAKWLLQSPFGPIRASVEAVTDEDRQRVIDENLTARIKAAGSAQEALRLAKEYDAMGAGEKTFRHLGDFASSIGRAPATFARTLAWAEDAVDYLQEKGPRITLTTTDLLNGAGWLYSKIAGKDVAPAQSGTLPNIYAEFIDNAFKQDPYTRDTLAGKLATGAGSAVPFLLGAMATGGSNLGVMLLGAGMSVGEQYKQAKDEGLSREKALLSGLTGIPLGMTEAVGLKWAKVGEVLQTLSKGKLLKSFTKWAADTGKEFTEEALQEYFQSTAGKVVIEGLKNDGVTPQMVAKAMGSSLEDGLTGGIVGLIFGGGAPLASHVAAKVQENAQNETKVPEPTSSLDEKALVSAEEKKVDLPSNEKAPQIKAKTPKADLVSKEIPPADVESDALSKPSGDTIVESTMAELSDYDRERAERIDTGDERRYIYQPQDIKDRFIQDNKALRDNPQTVVLYRSTIGKGLNPGDFVYLDKREALKHQSELGEEGARIISREVPIGDLVMGQDTTEFIYSPAKPQPKAEDATTQDTGAKAPKESGSSIESSPEGSRTNRSRSQALDYTLSTEDRVLSRSDDSGQRTKGKADRGLSDKSRTDYPASAALNPRQNLSDDTSAQSVEDVTFRGIRDERSDTRGPSRSGKGGNRSQESGASQTDYKPAETLPSETSSHIEGISSVPQNNTSKSRLKSKPKSPVREDIRKLLADEFKEIPPSKLESTASGEVSGEASALASKLPEGRGTKQIKSAAQALDSADLTNEKGVFAAIDAINRLEKNWRARNSENDAELKQYVDGIRKNIESQGYEIVDMLGKPWNDGMKVIANFKPDDDLYENEQIITRIIQPQVNKDGVMVRAAKVEVSQGSKPRPEGWVDPKEQRLQEAKAKRLIRDAESTAPVEPSGEAKAEPWQMTRTEWQTQVKPVRNQSQLTSEQRADMASSHRLGYRQREATHGKPFYSVEGVGIAFDTAKEAKERGHQWIVENAIREGKAVPPEVLADYPDLKTTTVPQTPKTQDEVAVFPEKPKTSPARAKRLAEREAVKEARKIAQSNVESGVRSDVSGDTKEKQADTVESAKAIAIPRSAVKRYAYADEVADQIASPEFKEAERIARTEKPSDRTGFTKTQTEWLAKALRNHVIEALDKQGFGSADGIGAEAQLAKFKNDPLPVSVIRTTTIDEGPIAVPDDGVIRVPSVEAANKLHQRITGKPIEGIEKAKDAAISRTNAEKFRSESKPTSLGKTSQADLEQIAKEQEAAREAEKRGISAEAVNIAENAGVPLSAIFTPTKAEKAQIGRHGATSFGLVTTANNEVVITEIPRGTENPADAVRSYLDSADERLRYKEREEDIAAAIKAKDHPAPRLLNDLERYLMPRGNAIPEAIETYIKQSRDYGSARGKYQRNSAIEEITGERNRPLNRSGVGSLKTVLVDYFTKNPPLKESDFPKDAPLRETTTVDKDATTQEAPEPLRSVPENLLQGIITDRGINYERVQDLTERVLSGDARIVRLDDRGERGRNLGGRRNVEATIILSASQTANSEASRRGEPGVEGRSDEIKRQERIIERYAREAGLWTDLNRIQRESRHVGGGVEARVFHKDNDPFVTKIIAPRAINRNTTPLGFLDRISIFNSVFPESFYTLEGVGRDSDGVLKFVIRQPFIHGGGVSENQVIETMKRKGFEPDGTETYSDGRYKVFDVHARNAMQDDVGNTYVIDAVPKLSEGLYQPFGITEAVAKDASTQETPEPLRSVPDENFGQSDYTFKESDYRPSVVEWAKEKFGDRVAPNGKPVYQNFTRWFGDSQVVNEKGEPLVVYHGTDADVEGFDPHHIGHKFGQDTQGFFFTSDQAEASEQAEFDAALQRRPNANVIPVYLSLQDPLTRSVEEGANDEWDNYRDKILREVKDTSADGVIIYSADGHNLYVAFEPNQIKSAIGNKGDFSDSPSILAKRPENSETLKELATTPVRDIISDVGSEYKNDNVVKLNPEGSELVRIALAGVQKTSRADQAIIGALFNEPQIAENVIEAVDEIANVAEENGLDVKPIRDLVKNLEKASKKDGTIIIDVIGGLEHEQVHYSSWKGADGKKLVDRYANINEIAKDKDFIQFWGQLNELQGQSTIGVAAEEALAYLGSGDYARFGLTEAQAVGILQKLVTGYAEANGVESLRHFEAEKIYEAVENFRKSQSSETSDDSRSEVGEEREAGPRPAKEKPDKAGEKQRSLPGTIREAGLEAEDESYKVFGNEEAIQAANDLIADLGLEKAIKTVEASTTYDKTHAVMSFMLQRALRNEAAKAEADGDTEYANTLRKRGLELASKHAELATQAGQFTQAAAMVADAVESVLYRAQKIADKRGRPLTPVEYEKFEQLGIKAENQTNDLDRLRKDIRNLKAQIKRLKEGKVRVVGTRINKKAIAQARKNLPDMSALMAQIKKDLRDADEVLRMVAWHGSPHTFDKFSTEKIGTGEGAQAYGHGLYFAGKEEVADFYRNSLARRNRPEVESIDGTDIDQWFHKQDGSDDIANRRVIDQLIDEMWSGSSASEASEEVIGQLETERDLGNDLERIEAQIAIAKKFAEADVVLDWGEGGAKYRVELKPAEDEYLDWDKPLSDKDIQKIRQQAEAEGFDDIASALKNEDRDWFGEYDRAQDALNRYLERNGLTHLTFEHAPAATKRRGQFLWDRWKKAKANYENSNTSPDARYKGWSLYQNLLEDVGDEPARSAFLHRAGIRGIKYLDGSSRGKGEGSYNYVIFDDNDVEILEVLRSIPQDPLRAKLAQYGASTMIDKPLSQINREGFYSEMRRTFGKRVDDILPQVFAESFNLRQQLLNDAKMQLASDALKADDPSLTDAEIKAKLKENEKARKERRAQGQLAKTLANLYKPAIAKQNQDVLDIVDEIADPAVSDYAEMILTKQGVGLRKDRQLYKDAMAAIRDAHKILRDEQIVIKQNIAGGETQLRDLEREEFLKRDQRRTTEKDIVRSYRRLEESAPVYYGKEALKLLGESRSLLASGDLSGSLRQGFYHSMTNPLLNIKGSEKLPSSYMTMLKGLLPQGKGDFTDRILAIENHPDFDIMKQMGVEFAEAGGGVAEENVRTEYLKSVPIVKNWLNVSERTYSGFLDVQRALWAESVINELQSEGISFRNNPEVYKAAGSLINIATGRGNVGKGKLKSAVETFGGVFFAPRFVVSRVQLLGHVAGGAATLPPGLRKIELKRAARFHTAITLPLLALVAAGIVAIDPDDDDFLKIRVGPKARYEFTGGLQSYIRLLGQIGKAFFQYADGQTTDKDLRNTLARRPVRFLQQKLAPVPSYGMAALTGKEVDTSEFNWAKGILNRLTPITVREIGAGYDDGVTGMLLTTPTILGIGTAYYGDGDRRKQKHPSMENYLTSPEFKRSSTDDLVEILETEDMPASDKDKLKQTLKKKAMNARKSKTLTQDEVDRIKKVMPDFNITPRTR